MIFLWHYGFFKTGFQKTGHDKTGFQKTGFQGRRYVKALQKTGSHNSRLQEGMLGFKNLTEKAINQPNIILISRK